MNARIISILIVAFCLASLIAVPYASAQGMPQAVFGIVRDSNSAPVFGSTVTLRNERTGGILSTTTDSLGRYSVELSIMLGGCNLGDVIIVKAVSGNLEGSSSFTVSSDPTQCDITISEKTGINPIVIGGVVIGLIALIMLAVLYSRHSKETAEEQEPKKGGKE